METRDIEIAKEGAAAGRLAEEQAAKGIRGLMTSAGTFAQTQANVASSAANRQALIDKANLNAEVQAAQATADAIQDAIENERGNTTLLQTRYAQITKQVDDMAAAFLAQQDVQALRFKLNAGQPVMVDGREIKSEQELIKYYRDQAKTAAAGSVAAYDTLQKQLNEAISQAMRGLGTPAGVSSVTPSSGK